MTAKEPQQDGLKWIANLDRTVHSPARLMILSLLSIVDGADFTFLHTQTGLTKGNLSSHLNVLATSGYVRVEKDFAGNVPHSEISLTRAGRRAVRAYARQMDRVIQQLLHLK